MGKVRDKDTGYKKFIKDAARLKATQAFSIGVFDSDPHEVMKAAVHEMGSPQANVPARRWLSKFFDQHGKEVAKVMGGGVKEFLISRKKKKDQILTERAEIVTGLVRAFLEEGNLSPDLKEETWKRKKTKTMLVESGKMTER